MDSDCLINKDNSLENHLLESVQVVGDNSTASGAILNAVLGNEHRKISEIIDNSSPDLFRIRYPSQNNQTIVSIACTHSDVTPHTLCHLYKTLKQKHADLDYSDDQYYSWEPLHYLAKTADYEKLAEFVDCLEDVDCLTFFSQNALHVLLTYSVQPFQVALCNGSKSKPFCVIGSEDSNIIECARILIKRGIDVNHANFWNETPICLAARHRYSTIVELLLNVPAIDLDNSSEAGTTVREYLKKHHICSSALLSQPSSYYQEDDGKILFGYLKSGNEKSFCEYNNENIKDYVDCFDRSGNHTCGTMLQFCFWKGYIEYLKMEGYDVPLRNKVDIMDTPMLAIFRKRGLKYCIFHLLCNDATAILTDKKHNDTILEAAAERGFYPVVAMLLHKYNDSNQIFEILPKLFPPFNTYSEQPNFQIYRHHVLYLLFDKLLFLHREERLTEEKLDVLYLVLENLNLEMDESENKTNDSEIICQILSLGPSLTYHVKDPNGKRKMLIDRIHLSILTKHFDDCIKHGTHYNYSSVIEDYVCKKNDSFVPYYSETSTLDYLMNDSLKIELILHPLMVFLIHRKWRRVHGLYYVNLLLYFAYFISICWYMVSTHVGAHNSFATFMTYVLYVLLLVQFIKEIIQIILYRCKYLREKSNYAELAIIGAALWEIIDPNVYARVISILLSTVMLYLMLGQMPRLTKYTIIFGSTKYFLQYFTFYSIQFFAFAICFYIVSETQAYTNNTDRDVYQENQTSTSNETVIEGLFQSLFLNLVRFTGQLDDPIINSANHPVFGRILTATFVFFMTIILNNLLVGLIVSDINDIQHEAKFHKHIKMAGFIIRTGHLIKILHNRRSAKRIKAIIDRMHIFKKGTVKIVNSSNYRIRHMFDDQDNEYIKQLCKKTSPYDLHVVQKVFCHILDAQVSDKCDENA